MSTMGNVIGFAAALQALQARRNERTGRSLTGLGVTDDLVYRVQYDLTRVAAAKKQAYFDPKGVDGAWGPNTAAAVKSFRMAAGLSVDGDTKEALIDNAFLAALAAAAKGANGASALPAAPAQAAPGAPTPPPGTTASLPPLEAAKQWLLAPGAPVYKKPILYIGVGIVGLTVLLAMRSRE